MPFGRRAPRLPALPLRALAALAALGLAVGLTAAPATAAPTGSPGVSHVVAATDGSTAVRLTWHTPRHAGRVATVIRYSVGTKAPSSPKAGAGAGRLAASSTTRVVRKLRPATRYAFALFAYYGGGRYSARAVARVTTAPDSVRLVQPFARGNAVTLTWSPPRTSSYASTVVRYAVGSRAPSRPTDGIGVHLVRPQTVSARLSALAPGATYAVAVWTRDRRRHYSTVATTRFTMPAPESVPTGTITGTVTDDADHPLAGVHVGLWSAQNAQSATTSTDAGGHYSLTAPAGSVVEEFDGADATGGGFDATGYLADDRAITVRAGDTLTESDALDPGGAIAGRVTDQDGNPLAGVSVYAQPPEPYVAVGGVFSFGMQIVSGVPTTGADGRYLLKGMPAFALQVCYATTSGTITGGPRDAAGYVGRCERGAVAVAHGATSQYASTALLAADTGAVTGVVTDSAGHPVRGVQISVTARAGNTRPDFGSALTDAAGRYRVAGLHAGRYDVCADPSPVTPPTGQTGDALSCRFAAATVTRGAQVSVDVHLRPAGGLAGRVRGPGGSPMPGAGVQVFSVGGSNAGFAVTDAHGLYVVPQLPAGRYRVCFGPGPGASPGAPTGVTPGCFAGGDLVDVRLGSFRVGVDATLAAAGAVSGTVSGIAGDITAGNDVEVDLTGPGDEEPAAFAEVDASGAYVVRDVPAGRYDVCVSIFDVDGNGTQVCHRSLVQVRTGRTTRGVNIAVPAAGSVLATVTDAGGHPVSGVDVAVVAACTEAEDEDGDCGVVPLFAADRSVSIDASAMTGPDGTVRISHVPTGHVAVCVAAYYGATPTGVPATGYLDACSSYGTFGLTSSAGHDTAVTFALATAGAVRGRVTDHVGHPLAGVRIVVSNSSSADYYDQQGADAPPPFLDFGPSGPAAEVTTDADGTYVVPGVRPGGQTVCFDAGDAIDVTGAAHPNGILGQCHGAAPGSTSGGTPVTVPAGGTVTGVDQQLTDGAAIAGRVVDARTKHGVGEAAVVVFAGQRVVTVGQTDGAGHYRLEALAPGTYHVCFADDAYASQCYDGVPWPGASAPSKASAVTIAAGATVTLKDARLRRG